MMIPRTFAFPFLVLLASSGAHAANLALFNFTGSALTSSDDDATNTYWTTTDVAAGPGVTFIHSTTGNPAPGRSMPVSETDGTNEAGAVAAGDYFTFTITPAAGNVMSLSGISLDFGSSFNTQPRGFAVRTSIDGYDASVWNVTVPINSDSTSSVFNFSTVLSGSQFENLTEAVTFRFYGFDNASSTSNYLRFDNITVTGTVVPEPSAGLLGMAGLGLAMLRRRRRSGLSL